MSRTWTLWTVKLCVPLASAAILSGCTQEVDDSQTDHRTAIDNRAGQSREHQLVSLTGCVSTGQGNNQFMLYNVRPVALGEQPTDAPSSANTNIPENVPVRLAMNDDDELEKLVGQSVSVTGRLNDGRNTIGTTGDPRGPGEPDSRVDQSQAGATGEHHSEKVREEAGPIGQRAMNNGTFPELTVTRVNGTGEKCVVNRVEDRR